MDTEQYQATVATYCRDQQQQQKQTTTTTTRTTTSDDDGPAIETTATVAPPELEEKEMAETKVDDEVKLLDDDNDETSAAARRLRAVADDILVQARELRERTEAVLLAYADQMVLWQQQRAQQSRDISSSSNDDDDNNVKTNLLAPQQAELERLRKVSRDIDATTADVEAKTKAALAGVVVVASSSGDDAAMAVEETPLMTVTTTETTAPAVVVRQKLVMLVSSIPLNRQVQANQEMDLTILQSNDIAYEVLDGVEEKVLRNALMDVSGRRGEYPQFFLVSVPDGHATFWGGHDEFVAEHDHGTLRDVFPTGAFSPRSGSPLPFLSAASDDDEEEEDGDDDVESPEDLAATTATTTKTVRLEDAAFAAGETPTSVRSGDGENTVATIGAEAEEVAAAAVSPSVSLEGSEIVPSSDIVIPTSAREVEKATIGPDPPSTATATTTIMDDEPAGFAPGPDIPTGTIMEDIGAQDKEAVMDQATDLGETIASSSSLPDIPTTGGTLEDHIGDSSAPVANIIMDGATDVVGEEETRSLADIPWPHPR